MGTFNGQLNANEVFGSLFNMILSMHVWAPEISKVETLASKARVDGGQYGDTKLYYSSNALTSREWGGDSEAANLLALNRPAAPACQAIVLNRFRIISLTVDNYLSKRAFLGSDVFSKFNNSMIAWMSVTKDVYDETLINAFYGTDTGTGAKQNQTVTLPMQVSHYFDGTDATNSDTDLEATARLGAQTIAEKMANIITDLTKDIRNDYNDNGFLRRYPKDRLQIIWNAKYVNKINKIDLPTIFHKDGVMEDFKEILPSKYFGTVITASNVATYSDSTPAAGKPIDSDTNAYTPGSNNANGTLRALEELEVTVSATTYHMFPGEELPSGAVIYTSATDNLYGKIYIEDAKVIAKVTVNGSVPFMSSFTTETNFFNPKSLTENKYLIWSHNTLEHLKNYPFVTLKEA